MNFENYPDSSALFSSCFDLDDNIDTDIYLSILEEEDEEDEKRTEDSKETTTTTTTTTAFTDRR